MQRVAVLGAGSWGTALAKLLAERGMQTRLWAREPEVVAAVRLHHENRLFLPGITLPNALEATNDTAEALDRAEMVVFAVPSHGLRDVARHAASMLPAGVPLVSATKGIENDTLMLVSQILEDVLPPARHDHLTYLSGPSFAREVATGHPTAVVLAGTNEDVLNRVRDAMNHERFRLYITEDVIGVEVGGALKNVIALAAGAVDGLGFGHNTRAALITRGIAEIARLAIRLGAHPMTMAGLSGVGDLVLTCTGDLSRNRSVGFELGRGRPLAEILGSMTMVAEGVLTAKSAYELAQREDVDMPITTEIYRVLYEGKEVRAAMDSLLNRPLRHERG